MNKPIVSVVMSCYNSEESVLEATRSILDQSFENFEFIIVDDGSADTTLRILEKISKEDDRIVLLRNVENIGLAASLNKGILASQAKYIARMDADDVALPERLEKQVAFLESHEDVDILGTSAYLRPSVHHVHKGETIMPTSHDKIVSRVFTKTMVLHPTIMVRKEVYDMALYDPSLRWAEDADLWFRIYDKVRWANLAEPLLIYTTKEKITHKIAKGNISVKMKNLKMRGEVLRFFPHIILDYMQYYIRLAFGK